MFRAHRLSLDISALLRLRCRARRRRRRLCAVVSGQPNDVCCMFGTLRVKVCGILRTITLL